jgi:hypothetical protein
MRDAERHPGISVHRITIGGGIMAALFAIGAVLIFVVGLPLGPWFLLASILLGGVVAVGLFVWHKRNPVEIADLHHPSPSNHRTDGDC